MWHNFGIWSFISFAALVVVIGGLIALKYNKQGIHLDTVQKNMDENKRISARNNADKRDF